MNWKNKYLWGIGIILTAIGGLLVAMFDGDESTKPDISGAVESGVQAVEIIKAE